MKKYLVLRMYSNIAPGVAYMSDNEQDAKDMARIKKNDENMKFVVVSVNVVAEEEPNNE